DSDFQSHPENGASPVWGTALLDSTLTGSEPKHRWYDDRRKNQKTNFSTRVGAPANPRVPGGLLARAVLPQQLLGLLAKLFEGRTRGKVRRRIRHDRSPFRWPASARRAERRSKWNCGESDHTPA